MRGLAVSVVLSVAIFTAWAEKPFDEKTSALAEIQAKYQEVEAMGKKTLEAAVLEKNNINKKGEEQLLITLNMKINDTKSQFEMEAKAVIREVIVQSKPMSVIQCIGNVSTSGRKKINDAHTSYSAKVVQIILNKIEKNGFDISNIGAILAALKDLTEEAKTKINGGGEIQKIKKQALQNCQSAELLLGDIEVNLHDPILNKQYIKTRQEIEASLRTLKTELNGELEKCLQAK